jgi:hypothetical protein
MRTTKLASILATVALLALSACTPKEEDLAGGPKANDGELAGAAPGSSMVLPGLINLTPPQGAHVVKDCEKIIAPSYDHPPNLVCVFFTDDKAGKDEQPRMPSQEKMSEYAAAMAKAGWKFAHLALVQYYFEQPRPGTQCSNVAVLVSLQDEELKALVAAGASGGPFQAKSWRGFSIPASLGQACGDDRKAK